MMSKLLNNWLILFLVTHLAATVFSASLNPKFPHVGHSKHPHAGHSKLSHVGYSKAVDSLRQNEMGEKRGRTFWGDLFFEPHSDVISYGTKLHFTVNSTSLGSGPDCFESNTFMLNNLRWAVKFCKMTGENSNRVADTVDGFLIYTFSEDDIDWLSHALVVFQPVITNEQIDGKIVKKMKHHYSKDTPQHSIKLIDWNTLLANCVNDSQFSVDVEVFVGPKRSMASEMAQIVTEFRVIVDDASESVWQSESELVLLQGTFWNVNIEDDGEKIAVALRQIESDGDFGVNEWSWNVTMTVSLLPFDSNAHMITVKSTHLFLLEKSRKIENFVSSDKFTKSYVKNSKAIFVVNLKVDPPQPLWEIDEVMNDLHKLF